MAWRGWLENAHPDESLWRPTSRWRSVTDRSADRPRPLAGDRLVGGGAGCRTLAQCRAELIIERWGTIGGQGCATLSRAHAVCGLNTSATPLMQYRSPVGLGPSSNTWP